MLENLDIEYLGTLQHAYGYATDVPAQLNDIQSASKEVREKAYYELFSNIYHQGTVYEATVYVLPFLIEMFNDPSMTDANGKGDLASLIAAIAAGNGYFEVHQHWIDKKTLGKLIGDESDLKNELDHEKYITNKIREIANPVIPLLIPYLKHEDYGVRDCVAESLPYYPEHFAIALPALEKACAIEPEEMSKEIMKEAIASIKGISLDEKKVQDTQELKETGSRENRLENPALEFIPNQGKRRSILAILSGLALIGFCLLVIGGTIAMFFDAPARPNVCVYGPVSLFLAYFAFQQYRLLFCLTPDKARAKIGCIFFLGGLMTFFGIASIGGILSDPKPPDNLTQWLFRFAGILFAGLFVTAVGYANYKMQKCSGQQSFSSRSIDDCEKINWNNACKYGRKDGLAIVLMAIVVCIIAFVIVQIEIPATGNHLTYEEFPFKERFPASGSDFNFKRGYRGTLCCDFKIDEQGFRDWIASQSRWEYCRPLQNGDWIWTDWSENIPKIEDGGISEGLYAGYGNGKGGRAVFDRKTNRVYYWTYY